MLRRMPGKYLSVVVTGVAAYPATPQVILDWDPDGYLFNVVNGAADAVVAISFDGTTDWMMLRMADATRTQGRAGRQRKVWFRAVSGSGAISVDFTASTQQ